MRNLSRRAVAELVALILAFGPISGARFNSAVTLADAWQKGIAWPDVPVYISMQVFERSWASLRQISGPVSSTTCKEDRGSRGFGK